MTDDDLFFDFQENVGHLLDPEVLWSGRLDDLEAGRDELRPADLENRLAHEAEHNQRAGGEGKGRAKFTQTSGGGSVESVWAWNCGPCKRTAILRDITKDPW